MQNQSDFLEMLLPYKGRIVGLTAAVAAGIVFLLWGFGEALLVTLLLAAGIIIGRRLDGRKDFRGNMKSFFKWLTTER
ncbi:small integral membrane protein DUF2273 [Sinobaca qinghaiensis]|uniref:Small integral membrane protein DUF2273 n=1 Tax=Sinobaca qinghaiensis TaxID=342944 RepID=A0A419V7S0_9BACL|nr:DUF2273 domain-containing protein [Sinobaca qinghaiensis]RKD76131.1 small integral membrane protein DUF2273 [Sinobaca qinghaiensis]